MRNGPRLGTSRRNTLDGPGLFFWTTGLMRDQPITEQLRAQFQVQAFNVTNHTNFANPGSAALQIYNVSGALSSTAGLIAGPTVTSGRRLQSALKLIFQVGGSSPRGQESWNQQLARKYLK